MVSTTDTAIGWTIMGLAAAGAAYYYSQSGKAKKGRGRIQAAAIEQSQRRESDTKIEPRDKKKRKTKGTGKASDQPGQASPDITEAFPASLQPSPSERGKNRKGEKQQQQQQQPSKLEQSLAAEGSTVRQPEPSQKREEDEGMSNVDFAKQILERKTGTPLKKPTTTNETVRTRKQGKRNEELPIQATKGSATNGVAIKPNGATSAQDLSTASSTTGADADDDLSSPEFGATEPSVPSGADVSDMLEAPKKGLSVLRLTEPSNPQPSRQSKVQKVAPEPETKKQRQNRQKNEMKKAARAEAEKERLAALEKQKRDVRVAEGRPMQNGVTMKKPQPPPDRSPWMSRPESELPLLPKDDGNGLPPFPGDFGSTDTPSLLDTFEAAAADVSREPKLTEGSSWEREMPSEEEQMRRISELDSDKAWSTVTKAVKGKKKNIPAKPDNQNGDASGTAKSTKHLSSSKSNGIGDNKYVMAFNDEETTSSTSLDGSDDEIITAPSYAKIPPIGNGKRY